MFFCMYAKLSKIFVQYRQIGASDDAWENSANLYSNHPSLIICKNRCKRAYFGIKDLTSSYS